MVMCNYKTYNIIYTIQHILQNLKHDLAFFYFVLLQFVVDPHIRLMLFIHEHYDKYNFYKTPHRIFPVSSHLIHKTTSR